MTDDTMRAEFEAWYVKKSGVAYWIRKEEILPDDDGVYIREVERQWEAWQAATRQAVERAAIVCDVRECADAIRALIS